MSDLYTQLVNSPPGRLIAPRVGLPRPARLKRRGDGATEGPGAVLSGTERVYVAGLGIDPRQKPGAGSPAGYRPPAKRR